MDRSSKDTVRALAAVKAIIDGRDVRTDSASIMVTLEHAVAAALLRLHSQNSRMAAQMLNEGLVSGVEERLSLFSSRRSAEI